VTLKNLKVKNYSHGMLQYQSQSKQNRRPTVVNRGALRLCRGGLDIQI